MFNFLSELATNDSWEKNKILLTLQPRFLECVGRINSEAPESKTRFQQITA